MRACNALGILRPVSSTVGAGSVRKQKKQQLV